MPIRSVDENFSICRLGWAGAVAAVCLAASPAAAGPPYRTDDPEPVDFQHFEFFTFSTGTRVRGDTSGDTPAIEFDYGIVPNGRIAIIAPMSFDRMTGEPLKWGYGDTDLEFKYRLIEQDKKGWRPAIGVVPSVKIPSGDFHRELGDGVARIFLPIWLQKDFGDWTTFGGGGYWINHGRGNKNFWYAGWVLQRKITDKLAIGAELFHQTADKIDKKDETGFNLAAIYDFSDNYHFLFSIGRGLQHARQTNELSWYIGLLVTDAVEKPPENKSRETENVKEDGAGKSSQKAAAPSSSASENGYPKETEKSSGATASADSSKAEDAEKMPRPSADASKNAEPKAAPAVFSWSGFFVGADIGGAWQRANEADTVGYVGPFRSSYGLEGPIGGPFVGFNWQMAPLVLGLEIDVEAAGVRGGEGVSLIGLRQRHDVRGSARGRIGVALERVLPYVAGGVALANFFPSALGESFNQARPGWTIGAGIECAIEENWSARLEYRHSDFGSTTYVSSNFDGNFYRVRVRDSSIRLGLAYHFRFPEPDQKSQDAAEADKGSVKSARMAAKGKRNSVR
ncbi:outer membrane protein [Methylosinus sp. Ce-a6]|uniref:outer membrane protein n=1 Tax=Methylosinus sp. Ce-a6 TaxID=2172005 RepID=UPI001357139F|nr:outer membrane protein [Methylosinus sp. Ce-a6]